jgi:uncharacterized DUF497 family protein
MRSFDWDPKKNKTNQADHRIDFQTAAKVFDDPFHVVIPDRVEAGEQRWHAIGMIQAVTVVVVVHTYAAEGSPEIIRIISCRRALKHERKLYEEA